MSTATGARARTPIIESLEPRLLLSGDVTAALDWIYYTDGTGREVRYGFSDGTMEDGGVITVPQSAIVSPGDNEIDPTYYWERGYGSQQVSLDTGEGEFLISIPTPSTVLPTVPTAGISVNGSLADWSGVPVYIADGEDVNWGEPGSDIDYMKLAYSPDGTLLNVLLKLTTAPDEQTHYVISVADVEADEEIAVIGVWNNYGDWAVGADRMQEDGNWEGGVAEGSVSVMGSVVEFSIPIDPLELPDSNLLFSAGSYDDSSSQYDRIDFSYMESDGWASMGGGDGMTDDWSGEWTFAARIAGVRNLVPGMYCGLTLGTGASDSDALFPEMEMGWFDGVYEGVNYHNKLLLETIGVDGDEYEWESNEEGPPAILGSFDPLTTVLDLKVVVSNNGRTVRYYYRTNSGSSDETGAWTLQGSHTLPSDVAGQMRSFGGDAYPVFTLNASYPDDTAPSAPADLEPTIGDPSLPQRFVPGDRGVVPVIVTNTGESAAIGGVTVKLQAISEDAGEGEGVVLDLGTITRNVSLGAGRSATFSFPVTIPETCLPGQYILRATIQTAGIAESDTGNNAAVTEYEGTCVWQFGNVGPRRNVAFSFHDDDNTLVTFKLAGPGYGELWQDGDSWMVSYFDTNASSKASILTRKSAAAGDDGEFDLGGLYVGESYDESDHSSLKSLLARTTNLCGDVDVAGSIGSVVFSDVLGSGRVMTVHGTASPWKFTAGRVEDLTIDAEHAPLASLTAGDYLAGTIIAPYLTKLTIKASRTAGGNFGANLNLSNYSDAGFSLAKATVGGEVSSSLQMFGFAGKITAGTWSGALTAATIGSLAVKGSLNGQIHATQGGMRGISIGSIKAGRVGDAIVTADEGIAKLAVADWQSGSITAAWVGKLTTAANSRNGSTGDFGADLTVTGMPVMADVFPWTKPTLGTMKIAGNMLPGTQIDVQDGYVNVLTVAKTVDHSLIRSAGDIRKLTIGASDGSDFGAGVSLDLLATSRHVADADVANAPQGMINAFTVKGLKVAAGTPTPRFFENSFVSAGIGKMSLLNWDGVGGLFGPQGKIGSVKHTDTADRTHSWVWPDPDGELSAGADTFVNVI